MIEGDGYSYKCSYDNNGNVTGYEIWGAGGYPVTINHSGDQLTSIFEHFTDDGVKDDAKSIPVYDSQGNIVGFKDYDTSGELMEDISIAPRKINTDGTLAEYQVSSEYPVATYTYMEI